MAQGNDLDPYYLFLKITSNVLRKLKQTQSKEHSKRVDVDENLILFHISYNKQWREVCSPSRQGLWAIL